MCKQMMKDAMADEDAIRSTETRWAIKELLLMAVVTRLMNWKSNQPPQPTPF